MKKNHYKIHLIEVSDKYLEEAPAIVRKVYRAIQNKEPVSKQEKELAVKFTDYFRLEEVQMRSFSEAFKRVSNVKEAIQMNRKKFEKVKQKTGPGTISISGEVTNPESIEALGKLIGHEQKI
jgi:hypothetical protein